MASFFLPMACSAKTCSLFSQLFIRCLLYSRHFSSMRASVPSWRLLQWFFFWGGGTKYAFVANLLGVGCGAQTLYPLLGINLSVACRFDVHNPSSFFQVLDHNSHECLRKFPIPPTAPSKQVAAFIIYTNPLLWKHFLLSVSKDIFRLWGPRSVHLVFKICN